MGQAVGANPGQGRRFNRSNPGICTRRGCRSRRVSDARGAFALCVQRRVAAIVAGPGKVSPETQGRAGVTLPAFYFSFFARWRPNSRWVANKAFLTSFSSMTKEMLVSDEPWAMAMTL